jgi:hypothetical protein
MNMTKIELRPLLEALAILIPCHNGTTHRAAAHLLAAQYVRDNPTRFED